MRREVPPATTVVPDPDAYVATPVVTTVRRRRIVSRETDTGLPRTDPNPWLWLLGLLVLLLVAFVLYFATRSDTQPAVSPPTPAATVVVQQPAAPAPAAPPVIVQQPPVVIQQAPAQAPAQQATQAPAAPAPSAS